MMEEVQRAHTQFLPESFSPEPIDFALHCSFGGRRDLGGCSAGSQQCLSQRTRAQELQELPSATQSAGGAGAELLSSTQALRTLILHFSPPLILQSILREFLADVFSCLPFLKLFNYLIFSKYKSKVLCILNGPSTSRLLLYE